MRNCWLNRTPLQTALLLMLLIIIPFLIILIILYVIGIVTTDYVGPVESCTIFCSSTNKLAGFLAPALTNPQTEVTSTDNSTTKASEIIKSKPDPKTGVDYGTIRKHKKPSKPGHGQVGKELDGSEEGNKSADDYVQELQPFQNHGRLHPEYNFKSKYEKSRLYPANQNKEFVVSAIDSTDAKVCPSDMDPASPYPTIVAILQVVYVREGMATNMAFLCSGAIISDYWVLSSSECLKHRGRLEYVKNSMLIRAGSEYWSKGGSLHEVDQISKAPVTKKSLQNSLLLLKVKYPFMNNKWVQPVHLSKYSTYQDQMEVEMFGWYADDQLEYSERKKFAPIVVKNVELHKDSTCHTIPKKRGVFCAIDITSTRKCDFLTGSPVIKNNYLLGVNIINGCMQDGKSVYYFWDVSYYYDWIKSHVRHS